MALQMADWLSLATLFVCFSIIVVLAKFFGRSGLFAYSSVAMIVANIQVLKLTKYSFFNHEVALGTVVFATTFVVDNIMIEYFGAKNAKKSVWLSFVIYLFFVVSMKLAIMHPVVQNGECCDLSRELTAIFSPGFVLFMSSVLAYFAGQFCDIFVFVLLKKVKQLVVKSFISMSISTFVDNAVFSIFAWIIFASSPISWNELWNTYIINLYVLRLVVVLACIPLIKVIETVGVDRVREF